MGTLAPVLRGHWLQAMLEKGEEGLSRPFVFCFGFPVC